MPPTFRFLNTADNVMYTTSENVARQQNSGLEIVGKNNLFSILSLTTTVNLYYSKLDGFSYLPEGAEAPVIGEEDESFNWNVRMIANVSLPWGVSLQGTGNYNSGLPQIPHHYIRRRFLAGFRELAWWQKSWFYPDLQLRQYEQEKRQKQERGTGHV